MPTTQSNSSEGARGGITQSVPEKKTWPADDLTDVDLKKKDRDTIDECPICLEGIQSYTLKIAFKKKHFLLIHLFCFVCLQNMISRTRNCSQNVAMIFILRAFLNGWKEVRLVQFVTRFVSVKKKKNTLFSYIFDFSSHLTVEYVSFILGVGIGYRLIIIEKK